MHSDGDVESLVKLLSPSVRPTVCITRVWAGVDSVWDVNAAEV